jgi:tRNA-dihydrouridine synthase B
MAEAARRNVDAGAQIIDINMGCPAKKVCNKDAGSALLRDERWSRQILQATVAARDAPVTLKIRTGWAPEQRNAVRIARMAEDCGISALAVHGRTRACRFNGEAEYADARGGQAVRAGFRCSRTATSTRRPGDRGPARHWCRRRDDLVARRRDGRGSSTRSRSLAGDLRSERRHRREVRDIMLAHLRDLYEFYGPEPGVRIARKHIGWYCSERPHAQAFRQAVMRAALPMRS